MSKLDKRRKGMHFKLMLGFSEYQVISPFQLLFFNFKCLSQLHSFRCFWTTFGQSMCCLYWWCQHAYEGDLRCTASHRNSEATFRPWAVVWSQGYCAHENCWFIGAFYLLITFYAPILAGPFRFNFFFKFSFHIADDVCYGSSQWRQYRNPAIF